MAKITFPKKYLVSLGLPYGAISNKLVGHRRWSVDHEIIFDIGGKYYKAFYSVGATESQDESPWENMSKVDCTEVHLVQKTVMVWEEVKE